MLCYFLVFTRRVSLDFIVRNCVNCVGFLSSRLSNEFFFIGYSDGNPFSCSFLMKEFFLEWRLLVMLDCVLELCSHLK